MKTYAGVGVQIHTFLASAPVGGEWPFKHTIPEVSAVLLYNRSHRGFVIKKSIAFHSSSLIVYIVTCFGSARSSSWNFATELFTNIMTATVV
jgi:hypothetical protein